MKSPSTTVQPLGKPRPSVENGKRQKRKRDGPKTRPGGGKRRRNGGQRGIEGGGRRKLHEDVKPLGKLLHQSLPSLNSVLPPTMSRLPETCPSPREETRLTGLGVEIAVVGRTDLTRLARGCGTTRAVNSESKPSFWAWVTARSGYTS